MDADRVGGGNSASSSGLLLWVGRGVGVLRRVLLLLRCLSRSVCWAISIEESNDARIELEGEGGEGLFGSDESV